MMEGTPRTLVRKLPKLGYPWQINWSLELKPTDETNYYNKLGTHTATNCPFVVYVSFMSTYAHATTKGTARSKLIHMRRE